MTWWKTHWFQQASINRMTAIPCDEHDGDSNHRRLDCLRNRLFRRKSKKTAKLRVTGLCEGNSPVNGPVTRKVFPFGDVIMRIQPNILWLNRQWHVPRWQCVTRKLIGLSYFWKEIPFGWGCLIIDVELRNHRTKNWRLFGCPIKTQFWMTSHLCADQLQIISQTISYKFHYTSNLNHRVYFSDTHHCPF